MTPLRIAFLLVFVAAAAAFVIARSAVSSLSLAPQVADVPVPTAEKTVRPKATVKPSPQPTRQAPSPTPTRPPPTSAPRPTATPMPAPTLRPRPSATATPAPPHAKQRRAQHATARHLHRSRPHPSPTPRPTATSGVTTLTNYWISQTAARRGTTIAVGYTIDNGTGRPERVMLGASIKPSSVATWGRSISDPFHDVVAVVPPGVTTHVRYFTLAHGLHPGQYDVAWGLRNAATGSPVALVAAPVSLRVTR